MQEEQLNEFVAATTKAYGECRSGSSYSTVVGLGGDSNNGNDQGGPIAQGGHEGRIKAIQEQLNEFVAATTKAYGECRSGSSYSTVVGLGGDSNDRNDQGGSIVQGHTGRIKAISILFGCFL
jgi:hypothetical protein